MNKKYIIIIVILGGVIIYSFFYITKKQEYTEEIIDESFLVNSINTIEESNIENNKIKIHITGEVNMQGIIEIDEGGRIADAIEAAGGITMKADITKVNLAYVLEDGQKLYIPSIEDQNFVEIQENSGENVIITTENKTSKIITDKISL